MPDNNAANEAQQESAKAEEQERKTKAQVAEAAAEAKARATKIVSEAHAAEVDATYDLLIGKPKRVHRFHVITRNDDGSQTKLKVTFQALDPTDYDELREAHPPTEKQKKDGYQLNVDTFAPALIAAVSYSPTLSIEQATTLYNSPNYSTGEREGLFYNAQLVCNAAIDVPFTDPD